MHYTINLTPLPRGKRRSWPWKDMLVGDTAEVHGSRGDIRSAAMRATGYIRHGDPHFRLRTRTVHPEGDAPTYVTVEAVDPRIEGVRAQLTDLDRKKATEDSLAERDRLFEELQAELDQKLREINGA